MERTHEVVARRLWCRVWRVRIILCRLQEELLAVCKVVFCRRCRCGERRFYAVGMCQFECAVHLVCRYMIEALAVVFLRKALPICLCSLQQGERSHDVGACKRERILYAAVHMTFRREVYYTVHVVLFHKLHDCIIVADVRLYEDIVGFRLYILQVRKVAGISKLVEVDDVILGILVHEEAYNVTSYKAGAAGDDDILHIAYILIISFLFLITLMW